MGWKRFRRSSAACVTSRRPGSSALDDATLGQLRELTQALIAAKTGAAEEHARFLAIAERGLCLPEAELAGRLRDATVLVTGGTGCIGSTLMAQLAARGPGRLGQREPRCHQTPIRGTPTPSTGTPTSGTAPPWTH